MTDRPHTHDWRDPAYWDHPHRLQIKHPDGTVEVVLGWFAVEIVDGEQRPVIYRCSPEPGT